MAFAAVLTPRTASSQSWWNGSWRAKRKIILDLIGPANELLRIYLLLGDPALTLR